MTNLRTHWLCFAVFQLLSLAGAADSTDASTSRVLQRILDNNSRLLAAIETLQYEYESTREYTDPNKQVQVRRGEVGWQGDLFYGTADYTDDVPYLLPSRETARYAFDGKTYVQIDPHDQRIILGHEKLGGRAQSPLLFVPVSPLEAMFYWTGDFYNERSFRQYRKQRDRGLAAYEISSVEQATNTSGPITRATLAWRNDDVTVSNVVSFAHKLNDLPIRTETYYPDRLTSQPRLDGADEIREYTTLEIHGTKFTFPTATLHTEYTSKTPAPTVLYRERTRILPGSLKTNEPIDAARFQLPHELPGYRIHNSDTKRDETTSENLALYKKLMQPKLTPPSTTTLVRGSYTATVRVQRSNAQPAAGLLWSVNLETDSEHTTIAQGVLSADGIAEVAGLDGMTTVPGQSRPSLPYYSFNVAEDRAGFMDMFERNGHDVLPLPGGAKHKEFAFVLPVFNGDPAPEAEFLDMETSVTVRISDYRGQVLLLDFWGTGCPPCQKPLADYHALALKNADKWRGRVTILTASINETPAEARAHMRAKGWSASPVIVHAWCGSNSTGQNDEKSPANIYGVLGVPTVCLIDRTGKIVARGDISNNIEQRIEALLE